MTSLLRVLKRVSEKTPNKFIAPIPSAQSVSLFSLQEGIPYWFNIDNPTPGWFEVEPISKKEARIGREAEPHEYISYLEALPRILVIVLFSIGRNTSLVVPYNASDASQRGWMNSMPRVLHLTRNHLCCKNPLSIISARIMGNQLLYDRAYFEHAAINQFSKARLSLQIDSEIPKLFQVAFDIVKKRFEEERERQRQLEAQQKRQTVKGQFEDDLSFVGADLVDWNESVNGWEVTYEYEGASFTMQIGLDKRIESAGICLDGTEGNHNLSTIVLAMQQARKLRRFDLDEELYLYD